MRGAGSSRENYSCLTMHQPWASLLIHGIKRVECRSWASPIRGGIWIHAASRIPDAATIEQMENFYSEIYALDGITDIKFPDHYPVSRLLGYVEVVGCVTGKELQIMENIPKGARLEGQSDFCWLCEHPQKLLVPIKMRGFPSVYNLEKKSYEAAIRNLTPVKGPMPVKFPLLNPCKTFSWETESIPEQFAKVSKLEESSSLTEAIAGARVAANQFKKKDQNRLKDNMWNSSYNSIRNGMKRKRFREDRTPQKMANSGPSDITDEVAGNNPRPGTNMKHNAGFSKIDFIHTEVLRGKEVNILEGLELHTGVFSPTEQKGIVDFVHTLVEQGRKGELKERTFAEPAKWKRGKGRITIQFGCCYNYKTDEQGRSPGINQDVLVDRMPYLFQRMIRRLVEWRVLPPTCVPDTCIVNVYAEGDCIPPHIDHHDFARPFCTVSFLSECDIVFGTRIKILSPGEVAGPIAIPLPVGSVLVLNGNAADVAKHCVPSVPRQRISITFRKMLETKRPHGFIPDPY